MVDETTTIKNMQCVAKTSLPVRVVPEKRALYGDIVERVYGDRFLTGQEVAAILGERKLVEEYPYHNTVSDLYRIVPPKEFPSRIGIFRDGRLHVSIVDYGTRVRDAPVPVPEGYRIFWFSMQLQGTTLTSLKSDRLHPLRDESFFPNCMNNIVSVGFVVPVSEFYIIFEDTNRSGRHEDPIHERPWCGPPLFIVPDIRAMTDRYACLRQQVIDQVLPYTVMNDVRDRIVSWVRVSESFIPMDGSPSVVQFSVRYSYTMERDPTMNAVVFSDLMPGAQSDLVPYISSRAQYIETWQRLERDTQGVASSLHLARIKGQGNTTRYRLALDTDGRFWIEYYIDDHPSTSVKVVRVVSDMQFDSAIPSPSTLYDTETHLAERLGFFNMLGSTSMISTLDNTVPSHLDANPISDACREAIWRDESLYTYQKEGVEGMVRHEAVPDGFVGLYMTRLTGPLGQPGLFQDPVYDMRKTVYIDKGFDYIAGMLCDETGMGKTRQITGLIRHGKSDNTERQTATLIVVSPTILHQWVSEIKRVWPECRIMIAYGRHRRQITMATDMFEHDIAITTYTTVVKYIDDFTVARWSRVVLDEAHTMPRSFPTLRLQMRRLWCVTATPEIQWRRIATMMIVGCDRSLQSMYTITTRFDGSYAPEVSCTMWRFFRPLVFRRTRTRYLELPEVETTSVYVDMSDEERQEYHATVEAIQRRGRMYTAIDAMNTIRLLQGVATTGRQTSPIHRAEPTQDTWFHPESTVPYNEVPRDDDCAICMGPFDDPVRTVCHHWFCKECIGNAMMRNAVCPLCRARIDPGTIFLAAIPEQQDNQEDQQQDNQQDSENQVYISSKTSRVVDDIMDILESDPTDRILVFFDTRTVLDSYAKALEHHNIAYTSIHGGVAANTRSRRIDQFQYSDDNDGCRVMLLTIKTASAGITLTRANHILLTTPVVPKDLETQMIGRSHRLGQHKPVFFTRYITRDTIEDPLSNTTVTTRTMATFVSEYIFHRV
jgi:hypothetical protein